MTWKPWPSPPRGDAVRVERPAPTAPSPAAITVGYGSLHQYLTNRFANVVVLTFAQIEDLLGFVLPDGARRQSEWWASADGDESPSVQSRSWTEASRTATPNLQAQNVTFERADAEYHRHTS